MKSTSGKKNRKNIFFRKALTRTFLLTTALPILFLLVVFSVLLIRRTKENNENGFRSSLSIFRSSFDHEINGISEFSEAYKNNKKIRTFFYYYYLYNDGLGDSQILTYRDRLVDYATGMNAFLKLANSNILGVGFVPASGNMMIYHEKGESYNTVESNSELEKDWYRNLLENPREKVIGYEYNRNLKNPDYTLQLCSTVYDNHDENAIGYFIIDISPDLFLNTESDISTPEGTVLAVTMEKLGFISVSDPSIDAETVYSAVDASFVKKGDTIYYVMKEKSGEYGFTLTYLVPESMIFSGMLEQLLLMFVLFLLLFALSIIVFSVFSKNIVNSFSPIRSSLSLYRGGERVPKIGSNEYMITEIAEIADLVDAMVDEVDDHIHKEYMSQIAEKKAEFRALQAEINPHFLYNTLNNFQALNRLGEQKLLEESIQSLSNLFRYTCEKEPSGISTVGAEVHFLENYLHLQKIRYDERLSYSFSIDEKVITRKIPKLIMQPLVENAIVHGLEPCAHPVHIQIAASSFTCLGLGEICLLSVINDGEPLIQEDYRNNSRVGLKNIEERLKTFWPDSALFVKGGIGQLTEFHIVIKEQTADNDKTENEQ